jgi:acetyl esterase/lipase
MTASEDFHPDLDPLARELPQHIIDAAMLPGLRKIRDVQISRTSSEGIETIPLSSGAGMRVLRGSDVTASPAPALLWLHGGGYVTGSAHQDEPLYRRYA